MKAPWLASQAQRLLAQPAHALLLHGPSGLGQFELALALVRGWLCERASAQGACGECGSCHAIDVHTHADLCVLMPETEMLERAWPLPEKAQQELDDKKRKPSREIRVDALREAIVFAQRTSARGRGKAVLVYPAERMNPVSANALLKTLEEPAGQLRFVLATGAAHQLLPTIRSRCLSHAMTWPEPEAAAQWLAGQGVPPEAAAALLRAAGNRPDDALRRARAGLQASQWARLPKALARGEVQAVAGWSAADALDALQKLCHDLLAISVGGAPRFFAPGDLPPAPSAAALGHWWRELAVAARSIEHPYNPGLLLEALVSRACAALHSQAFAE